MKIKWRVKQPPSWAAQKLKDVRVLEAFRGQFVCADIITADINRADLEKLISKSTDTLNRLDPKLLSDNWLLE